MLDLLTDVLEVLGLLLIAAALAFGLEPLIGWFSLGPAGVVLIGGSVVADWLDKRRPAGERGTR